MTTPRVKHPRRSRIHPYLNSALRHQLDEYATKHGLTESDVVQEALTKHFEGTGDKTVLFNRLDNMTRAIQRSGVDWGAELLELRQQVVAQGQLLALLVPTFLSLLALVPPGKRLPKDQLQSAERALYEALGQRVAKDRTLLHHLPEAIREALEDQVFAKRWSGQPRQDDDGPRAASSARPDNGGDPPRAASIGAQPAKRDAAPPPRAASSGVQPDRGDDDAPDDDDDIWLDTEPDDDGAF